MKRNQSAIFKYLTNKTMNLSAIIKYYGYLITYNMVPNKLF